MRVAVLSGKGGTGKTTVSTHLAALNPDALYMDLDVEEPNGDLFLKSEWIDEIPVTVSYPEVDEELCTHCRKCSVFCQFNALIVAPAMTIVLKEICHACGGCAMVCPEDAISYGERPVGEIQKGTAVTGNTVISGAMTPGEYSGVPVIKKALTLAEEYDMTVIDSPPGTSCTTVASLEGCDLALIVTEPTPFALSDMKMVVEMLRTMDMSMAVIVNKTGLGDDEVYGYCRDENIPVIGEIPFSRELAEAYAEGEMLSQMKPDIKKVLEGVWERVQAESIK
ncbi:MAG: ATP-binding protein [Spirochaetales bacterium]|nr:ATP-binding protein [Spirochaetales bacterium]